MNSYIEVVFNIPVNRIFTFAVADDVPCDRGFRVVAPLGKKKRAGLVLKRVTDRPPGDYEIRSIDRVIDVFPSHQQSQVRVQLGSSIQAVVSQQLLPTADGQGRVVGVEVMIATAAIRNQIRDGKAHQIPSSMQGGAKHGMQTMDQSLADLVQRGRITRELAFERCAEPEGLKRLLGGR